MGARDRSIPGSLQAKYLVCSAMNNKNLVSRKVGRGPVKMDQLIKAFATKPNFDQMIEQN